MLTNLYITMLARLEAAKSEEDGQGLVEYGLILALVALLAIGALTALGGGVSGLLDSLANAFPGA